jgi:hypothetical protein
MPESIESFVAKLQAEGVRAGQQQADKLRAAAQAEADKTLADAHAQGEKIIADARSEADGILARGQTELKLAARDTALRLREALQRALKAVLAERAHESLADTKFIGTLLNVPADQRDKLKDWALAEIGQQAIDGVRGVFNLRAALAEAGFEYTISGRTVEVTTESVTAALSELLSPALRELLAEAINNENTHAAT